MFFCAMAWNGDDVPDEALRVDLDDSFHAAGYTPKQIAIDTGCDASWSSKYTATGTWPLWRLLRLSRAFWLALLPRLAARYGLTVVSVEEARAVAAVCSVSRALASGALIHPAEQQRVVEAVLTTAQAVDPMRRSA